MIVVAIIGLLAAIAIPSLSAAIGKAQVQACALNRRHMDAAKLTWALETKRPATAVPTDDDLFGQDRLIEHKPDCPAGGEYSLGAVREKCTCSLPPHAR